MGCNYSKEQSPFVDAHVYLVHLNDLIQRSQDINARLSSLLKGVRAGAEKLPLWARSSIAFNTDYQHTRVLRDDVIKAKEEYGTMMARCKHAAQQLSLETAMQTLDAQMDDLSVSCRTCSVYFTLASEP